MSCFTVHSYILCNCSFSLLLLPFFQLLFSSSSSSSSSFQQKPLTRWGLNEIGDFLQTTCSYFFEEGGYKMFILIRIWLKLIFWLLVHYNVGVKWSPLFTPFDHFSIACDTETPFVILFNWDWGHWHGSVITSLIKPCMWHARFYKGCNYWAMS